MNPTRRLAPLLLLLFFAPLLIPRPGRAQTPDSNGGYAFADTTLLRDTLGLSFPRLFRLADSLHVTPDSLKAISVRYRWSLSRLVTMADSLGTIVDSVGPIMTRERFNPLLAQAATNQISYNSQYDINQQQTSWHNLFTYNYVRGGFILNNSTDLTNGRTQTGGVTSLHNVSVSTTNVNWRVKKSLSAGVSAVLNGVSDQTPGSASNIDNSINNFNLTLQSNQQFSRSFSTRLNLLAGLLDSRTVDQNKRGLSAELNGSARYLRGTWLTHDLSGRVAGNASRLGIPFADDGIPGPDPVSTQDFSTDLRGTLGLWPASPVGLNLNYRLNNTRVATPGATVVDTLTTPPPGIQRITVQDVNTGNNNLDATIRLRQDNDRFLNLTANLGNTRNATAGAVTDLKTVENSGVGANANYVIGRWRLTGNFGVVKTVSAFPRFAPTGGYQENQEANSLSGNATWIPSQPIQVLFTASIGLTSFTYQTIGSYPTTPVPHDQYSQAYSINPKFALSPALNTDVKLDVQRNQFINIPATSTASNTEGHTYRATWTWSFAMFQALTVSQINVLGAIYTFYPFVPSSNRLALTYKTTTTLSAVLNPRVNISTTIDLTQQPSGNYLPQVPGDPTEYFSRADEDNSRQLQIGLTYKPSTAISFNLRPTYLAIDRNSTVSGVLGPERTSRNMTLDGSTDLNVPVAKGCTLTGHIGRTYQANRSTSFSATAATQSPLSESDFWNGSLSLNWTP
jgi:hypothetical protein